MKAALKRMTEKISCLIISWLYASGMAMMLVHHKDALPSAAFVLGYTLLAAGILLVMGLGKKSAWLTLAALLTALGAALIGGFRPISALERMARGIEEGNFGSYVDEVALATSVLLFLMAYLLSLDRHGVYVLLTLSLLISGVCWFIGHELRLSYAIMPALSVSALFSVSGNLKQSRFKALLSASLIAAILSYALVPAQGVKLKPLENASAKVLRTIIEFFNLDRANVEERNTFSLYSYGWRRDIEAFGGPARPVSDEVLRVEADETLYLRGSIRYTYNGRAWIDEANEDKAGKIKRYMTTGIEGMMYRDQYDSALDLDKKSVIDRYFGLKSAEVELLSDNIYWSVYTPNRTEEARGEADLRVYYNNIGELFASRPLRQGDRYTLSYYSFNGDENALAAAVRSNANNSDKAYQAALLLNRDIPDHTVDARLFALVEQIIRGKEDDYARAAAIRDFLYNNGVYTLTPGEVPAGQDFVSYFVLGDRRGYCMYFASAMTLMARVAGLPARYVEGYLARPDESGACVLTGRDAHAWCEVYFKGFGWVTFDATPPEYGEDGDRTSDTGESRFEGGSQSPTPTPTPTPTPAPTPTPTPTPSPSPTPETWQDEPGEDELWPDTEGSGEDEEQNGDEPEGDEPDAPDDGGNEPDGQNDDGQNDPGGQDPDGNTDDAPEDPDAEQKPDNADERTRVNPLWLLAAFVPLAILLIAFRLRRSSPEIAQKRYASAGDRLLVWYKACILALEAGGLSLREGYTPVGYAEKALSMELADKSFLALSREVARARYSESGDEEIKAGVARSAYRGIVRRMKRVSKLKWYLKRVKNQLGGIEQVP